MALRQLILPALFACSGACAQSELDWVNAFGTNGFEGGLSVAADSADNVYLGGFFVQTIDFDLGPGVTELTATIEDPFVAKYDAAGDFVWAKHYSGRGKVRDMVVDSNDNLLLAGEFSQPLTLDATTTLTPASSRDLFFAKLDPDGNVLWARSVGGNGDDLPDALAIDSNDNLILAGTIAFAADLDPGPGMFEVTRGIGVENIVAKYDSNGDFQWGMLFEQQTSSGVAQSDSIGGLLVDNNDDIYAAGQYIGSALFGNFLLTSQTSDAFIVKISAGGVVQWAQSTDGPGLRAGNFAIDQDSNGNLYTTGIYLGQKDFDPDPVDEELSDAAVSLDMFVSSYDANGDFRWISPVTGAGVTLGIDLLVQANDRVTVGGEYSSTVDFDPLGGGDIRTAQAGWDSFFQHYDAQGAVISSQTLDGTPTAGGEQSAIQSLAATSGGDLLVAGQYRLPVDFQPGAGEFLVVPEGGPDIFVARYRRPDLIFADGYEGP